MTTENRNPSKIPIDVYDTSTNRLRKIGLTLLAKTRLEDGDENVHDSIMEAVEFIDAQQAEIEKLNKFIEIF